MNVLLYGHFGKYPAEIEEIVKKAGLAIVQDNPEVVITFGGDGTLLGAEQAFPAIPKLPLRDSNVCFHCSPLPNDKILEHLAKNQVETKEYLKLEGVLKEKKFTVLNEFVIRNKFQTTALRFTVTVNSEPLYPEPLIGDGLIVATPFGSTGYYLSIVRDAFKEGFGLAFNNIRNFEKRSILLPEMATAEVEITRGPGLLSRDNNPEIMEMLDGDKITITKASQTAKILVPA